MKNLLVLLLWCLPTLAGAQTVSAVLDEQVMKLQNKLGSGASLAMARNGLENDVRNESFNIQAIARLFKRRGKVFEELKQLIKVFEDHVGSIEKWASLGSRPNLSVAEKAHCEKNFRRELKKFSEYLGTSGFLTGLKSYRSQIAALRISEQETKAIVVAGIKEEIQQVLVRKYDFTHGETGLHELRRNLRWPLMEFDAFKSLFTVTPVACARSLFYDYGVTSHYTVLKPNPRGSFKVDYCSYVTLSGAVIYLGEIKDDLERRGLLEHQIPEELVVLTSKIYRQLKRDVLPGLL